MLIRGKTIFRTSTSSEFTRLFPFLDCPRVCRPGVDDFEYLSGAHNIEQSLHGRSRIHETHTAIPGVGQVAQCNQRAQAGAIHEFRPGQINFDGRVSVQAGANLPADPIAICGGQLGKSPTRQNLVCNLGSHIDPFFFFQCYP